MSDFVKVAARSEISPGSMKAFDVNGRGVALFNIGGNFCAIDDTCPHRGGPLSQGSLEENVVTCPWHGWRYDVTTGACLNNPSVSQKRYPVQVKGEDLYVSA